MNEGVRIEGRDRLPSDGIAACEERDVLEEEGEIVRDAEGGSM